MEHVYLTKEEIDRSYRRGAITVREVKELLTDLNQQAKRVVQNKIARHENKTFYNAA